MGLLYPKAFPSDLRLCGYAMWFDHVEVNSSYYAIPRREAVEQWVKQTPANFLFDLRLPRAVSQSPRQAGKDGRLINLLRRNLEPLLRSEKLGSFLLVLSPFFKAGRHQLEELDPLIERIRPHSLAVELRHCSWISDKFHADTIKFFQDRRLTWVSVDMPQIKGSDLMPPVDVVTEPRLAYLRLHGRNPRYLKAKSAEERHTYAYRPEELNLLVQRIHRLSSQAAHVRVVANNHAFDYAPRTALALKSLLGQQI
jgi:uncharacterized protein YecE (DUF72 family)